MRVYILGICGTFMGGIALLARQLGYEVAGSDENVYPPMSTVLRESGVTVHEGYLPEHIPAAVDYVIIGNAMSRGNPSVEYVLNKGIRYISGPQWLSEAVLLKRHVLAIAGTHGKTTTTSILTWILTHAGLNPGYLIGGVPNNFAHTAAIGDSPYFVIEADEYDSAFFDKRSKFLHYRPRTLVINNLEYDHADIFADMEAIRLQFHYLLRSIPSNGLVIYPESDQEVKGVITRGCWSTTHAVGFKHGVWRAHHVSPAGDQFELWHRDQKMGTVQWQMCGHHNVHNALVAIAAAHDVGVNIKTAIAGLQTFKGVKRRLEVRGEVNDITIYDDFAHHPTAIATTLAGLRARVGTKRIIAILQFGSYTMSHGVHQATIANALHDADVVVLLQPNSKQWNVSAITDLLGPKACVFNNVPKIVAYLLDILQRNDQVLIMSNKGFDGIYERLLNRLKMVSVA